MEKTIIIFFAITLINVVLSTIKSILTVKSSRGVATLINAIAYGFYAMVVKQMATVSTEVVVIATVICNLIGVYFSMWLLEKVRKDVLWKITVVPVKESVEDVKQSLINTNIGFYEYPIVNRHGSQSALDIFSESQAESLEVRNILEKNGTTKYHVLEIGKHL